MFQQTERLLIFHTAKALSEALRQTLEATSYAWESCADEKQLHEQVQQPLFDALVIDATEAPLPETFRLKRCSPHLPVVLLLPTGQEEVGDTWMERCTVDYLCVQQLSPAFLSKTLRQLQRQYHQRKRRAALRQPFSFAQWSYNVQKQSLQADTGILALLGLEALPDAPTLEEVFSWVIPEDRSILEQFIADLEANTPQRVHLRRMHPDLGLRYYELYCCLHEKDGSLEYVEGALQDRSRQQQVEKELFKSQERYQIVFSQSKDAIFLTSTEGKFIDFNPATCELLGYTPIELHSLHTAELYWNVGQRAELMQRLYQEGFVRDYPIQLRHKDGTLRQVHISASVVQSKGFKGIHGILRDVTQEQKNEELRRAKALAEERARLKEQFLAGISHEIRTPMNAILGMTGLLAQTPLNQEQLGYTQSIRQAANSLLQIINNILDAAQMQSGTLSLQNRPVALSTLLSSVQNIVSFKAKAKQLPLKLEVEERLEEATVLIDEARLVQVLINLLSNAVKFTDKGEVRLQATVDEEKEKPHLCFRISDTGDGISEVDQERIFERFVQVNSNLEKRRGGTGLGLAIVKQLVDLMQGSLELESQLGKGTTFTLRLPLEQIEQSSDGSRLPSSNSQAFRLLIAEDNDLNQVVAQRNIESGYPNAQILIARNGKEVLQQLEKQPVDMILMDLEMPILDGYETTKRIRSAAKPMAEVPILALTAHHFLNLADLKERGFNDLISKPFHPEKLLKTIEKHRPRED